MQVAEESPARPAWSAFKGKAYQDVRTAMNHDPRGRVGCADHLGGVLEG